MSSSIEKTTSPEAEVEASEKSGSKDSASDLPSMSATDSKPEAADASTEGASNKDSGADQLASEQPATAAASDVLDDGGNASAEGEPASDQPASDHPPMPSASHTSEAVNVSAASPQSSEDSAETQTASPVTTESETGGTSEAGETDAAEAKSSEEADSDQSSSNPSSPTATASETEAAGAEGHLSNKDSDDDLFSLPLSAKSEADSVSDVGDENEETSVDQSSIDEARGPSHTHTSSDSSVIVSPGDLGCHLSQDFGKVHHSPFKKMAVSPIPGSRSLKPLPAIVSSPTTESPREFSINVGPDRGPCIEARLEANTDGSAGYRFCITDHSNPVAEKQPDSIKVEQYLEAILKALLKTGEKDEDATSSSGHTRPVENRQGCEHVRVEGEDSSVQSRESGKEISGSDKPLSSEPRIHIQPPEGDKQDHDIAKGTDVSREFNAQEHSGGYGASDEMLVQVDVSAKEKTPDLGDKIDEEVDAHQGNIQHKEDGAVPDLRAGQNAEDPKTNEDLTQAVGKHVQEALLKPDTQQDVASPATVVSTGKENGQTEPTMDADPVVENHESRLGAEQDDVASDDEPTHEKKTVRFDSSSMVPELTGESAAEAGDVSKDSQPTASFLKSIDGEDAREMLQYYQERALKFEDCLSRAAYMAFDDMLDQLDGGESEDSSESGGEDRKDDGEEKQPVSEHSAEVEENGARLPSDEDMLEFVNGRVQDLAAAREIMNKFMSETVDFEKMMSTASLESLLDEIERYVAKQSGEISARTAGVSGERAEAMTDKPGDNPEDGEPPTSFLKFMAGGNEEGIEDAKAMWKHYQTKAGKFEKELSKASMLACEDMIRTAASQNRDRDTLTNRTKETSKPTTTEGSQTAKSAQVDEEPPAPFVKFVAGSNDETVMQDTRDMLSYFQGKARKFEDEISKASLLAWEEMLHKAAPHGDHSSTARTQEASTITEAIPPEATRAQGEDIAGDEPPSSFFKSLAGGHEEGIEDAKAMWKHYQAKAVKFEDVLSRATYLACDEMLDNVEVTSNTGNAATMAAANDIPGNDRTSKRYKSILNTGAEILTGLQDATQQIWNTARSLDRQTWLILFLMVVVLLSLSLNFVLTVFAIAAASRIL